jgi:hypothetical protein
LTGRIFGAVRRRRPGRAALVPLLIAAAVAVAGCGSSGSAGTTGASTKPNRGFAIVNSTPSEQTLEIGVKVLEGPSLTLKTKPSDSIASLKLQVEAKQGYEPARQLLFFNGVQLQNYRSVAEYGIRDGDVLHLILKLQ